MAAPAYQIGITGGTLSGTGNSVTPTLPATAADDILLLLVISHQPAGIGIIGTPNGGPTWNSAYQATYQNSSSVDQGRVALFWARATGDHTGVTVTVSRTGDTGSDSCLYTRGITYRGCSTDSPPWDDLQASIVASTTATWPAITVSGSERTLVTGQINSDNSPLASGPSSYNVHQSGSTSTGTDASMAFADLDNQSSDGQQTNSTSGETLGQLCVHFSLKPTASLTAVAKTLTAQYDMRQLGTKVSTLKYDVLNLLAKTSTLKYDILTGPIGKTLTALYDMRQLGTKSLTLKYDVRQLGTKSLTARYDVLNLIAKSSTLRYDVLNAIAKTSTMQYDVRSLLAKTSTLRYDIRNAIAKTSTLQYDLLNALAKTSTMQYDIRGLLAKSLTGAYDVRQLATKSLDARYDILGGLLAVAKTLTAQYDMRSLLAKTSTMQYDVRNAIAKSLTGAYDVRQLAAKISTIQYDVRQLATKTLDARYDMRAAVSKSLTGAYDVRGLVAKALTGAYDTRAAVAKALVGVYDVLGEAPPDEPPTGGGRFAALRRHLKGGH